MSQNSGGADFRNYVIAGLSMCLMAAVGAAYSDGRSDIDHNTAAISSLTKNVAGTLTLAADNAKEIDRIWNRILKTQEN